MKKTNACVKNSELAAVLNTHFEGKLNLARVKLIAHFVCALCKVRTVCFDKLANAFDHTAAPPSSLRRIQRFIAGFAVDGDLVARLVFALLPERERLVLTIDRTNWKFGGSNINIFMLGVAYKGVAFPLLFTMLEKRGNSNSGERIALVERFVRLFGKDCIECLVADREFVGGKWMGYLNDSGIRYHIRIRNNFKVWRPSKQGEVKAFHLFSGLKIFFVGRQKVHDPEGLEKVELHLVKERSRRGRLHVRHRVHCLEWGDDPSQLLLWPHLGHLYPPSHLSLARCDRQLSESGNFFIKSKRDMLLNLCSMLSIFVSPNLLLLSLLVKYLSQYIINPLKKCKNGNT